MVAKMCGESRICISVPMANDRVMETGVEEVFKMIQQKQSERLVV